MKNISGKDSFFLSVFLSSPSSQFNQPFDCVTQEEEEDKINVGELAGPCVYLWVCHLHRLADR
jgi:hypothetical protein